MLPITKAFEFDISFSFAVTLSCSIGSYLGSYAERGRDVLATLYELSK